MTLSQLRSQYPLFTYQDYHTNLKSDGLEISFSFKVDPDISFSPRVTILGVKQKHLSRLSTEELDSLAFNLGMIEILSYWKATCSQTIKIQAGYLSAKQLNWWKNLLIKGMGEFFFVNNIDFTNKNFVKIINSNSQAPASDQTSLEKLEYKNTRQPTLIPIGGGKDSVLTLEIFAQNKLPFAAFLLNPTPAAREIAQLSKANKVIEAKRVIDPKLLELNKQGFLNGHTPFSAYLAFLTTLVAKLFNYGQVAVSNERSSNEGNTQFHGQVINHQYSKTFEFEQSFTNYSSDYFSFLRPVYELQIAKILASLPRFGEYAPVMRSCNRGSKTNTWCHSCSKCLFVFIMLYPFVELEFLTKKIFSRNLFKDATLIDLTLELCGEKDHKPLECVGTHQETKVALYLAVEKINKSKLPLPKILQVIKDQVFSQETDLDIQAKTLLYSWNKEHNLSERLEKTLKKELEKANSS